MESYSQDSQLIAITNSKPQEPIYHSSAMLQIRKYKTASKCKMSPIRKSTLRT